MKKKSKVILGSWGDWELGQDFGLATSIYWALPTGLDRAWTGNPGSHCGKMSNSVFESRDILQGHQGRICVEQVVFDALTWQVQAGTALVLWKLWNLIVSMATNVQSLLCAECCAKHSLYTSHFILTPGNPARLDSLVLICQTGSWGSGKWHNYPQIMSILARMTDNQVSYPQKGSIFFFLLRQR